MTEQTVAIVSDRGDIAVLDTSSLLPTRRVERVSAFGGLAVSASCALDSNALIATCRGAMALVDVRTPADVVKAWRWNPAETLSAVTAGGPNVLCGTSEGHMVLFDLRTDGAPASHTVSDAGSAIINLASLDNGTCVSQASSGALRCWSVAGSALPPSGDLVHPIADELQPDFGLPGGGIGLAVAKSAGLIVATDDSGMIEVFAV